MQTTREPRSCAYSRCNVLFKPYRSNQRYCSDRCRLSGWKESTERIIHETAEEVIIVRRKK